MEPKSKEKAQGNSFRNLEITRRNLLQAAGVSALAFGSGFFQAGCGGPPEDVIFSFAA